MSKRYRRSHKRGSMDLKVPKDRRRKRMIPKPSGTYAVGCTDIMTSTNASGVFFRLYYPTAPTEGAEYTKWVPDKKYIKGYAKYFKMWPPIFVRLHPLLIGEIYVPASWNTPPLTNEKQQFPVIIFSHGLGACRTTYSTVCLELASNGYVVAAVEHRDYSANATYILEEPVEELTNGTSLENKSTVTETPCSSENKMELKKKYIFLKKVKSNSKEYAVRNNQVHLRSKECSAVLDWLQRLNDGGQVSNVLETAFPLSKFRNLLDFSKTGICGHSFGGATTIVTMAKDKRFKVGICLDPWMLPLKEETSLFSDLTQQMLFINNEKFQKKGDLKVMRRIESSSAHQPKVSTLKGTVHLNQTDVPFICNALIRLYLGSHSRMNHFQAMDLTTRLTLSFLSEHLDLPVNDSYVNYLGMHQEVIREGIPPESSKKSKIFSKHKTAD